MSGVPRINLESASEHDTEIERLIQLAKKSIRCIRQILPHKKVPKLLLIYLLFQAIKIQNNFPVKRGISDTISSTEIITCESLYFKNILV